MHVNDRKVFAMALVLVALMSIFVTVASADVGTQTWYIRSDAKLDKANAGSGTSSVNDNGWSSWSAGPAQCNLTMPAGTWTLYLDYDSTSDGEVTVEIWDDAEENMLAKESLVMLSSGSGNTISVDVNDVLNSVDFEATEYFVLWIGWEADTGTLSLTVNSGTSGESTLSSPSTDPGYPVPELSTLVLFSVGLLALVGYVAYRRRDR